MNEAGLCVLNTRTMKDNREQLRLGHKVLSSQLRGRESRAESLDGQYVGRLIRKQRRVCRADRFIPEASVMFLGRVGQA